MTEDIEKEDKSASFELSVVRTRQVLATVPARNTTNTIVSSTALPNVPTDDPSLYDLPYHKGLLSLSDIYSPYDLNRAKLIWRGEEVDYYTAYLKEYKRNPFMVFVIEGLLNSIFKDGYRFEGEGENEVEEFWFRDRLDDKLRTIVRHMIWCGNGYMELYKKQDILESTAYINGFTVHFDKYKTRDGKDSVKMVQKTINSPPRELDPENVIHFKMNELGDSFYGMSLIRPNFFFLMALRDTMGDIPAAVKRIAYAPMVAYLDLEGVKDDATKQNIIRDYGDKLHAVISATSNYVLDKRHKLEIIDGNAQNLNTRQIMEPLFEIIFLNFNIPLTVLRQNQTKSGSLYDTDFSRNGIKSIQSYIANKINYELIPHITKKPVKFKWEEPFTEKWNRSRMLLQLYGAGVISREYLLQTLDIDDKGTTFIQPGTNIKRFGGGI